MKAALTLFLLFILFPLLSSSALAGCSCSGHVGCGNYGNADDCGDHTCDWYCWADPTSPPPPPEEDPNSCDNRAGQCVPSNYVCNPVLPVSGYCPSGQKCVNLSANCAAPTPIPPPTVDPYTCDDRAGMCVPSTYVCNPVLPVSGTCPSGQKCVNLSALCAAPTAIPPSPTTDPNTCSAKAGMCVPVGYTCNPVLPVSGTCPIGQRCVNEAAKCTAATPTPIPPINPGCCVGTLGCSGAWTPESCIDSSECYWNCPIPTKPLVNCCGGSNPMCQTRQDYSSCMNDTACAIWNCTVPSPSPGLCSNLGSTRCASVQGRGSSFDTLQVCNNASGGESNSGTWINMSTCYGSGDYGTGNTCNSSGTACAAPTPFINPENAACYLSPCAENYVATAPLDYCYSDCYTEGYCCTISEAIVRPTSVPGGCYTTSCSSNHLAYSNSCDINCPSDNSHFCCGPKVERISNFCTPDEWDCFDADSNHPEPWAKLCDSWGVGYVTEAPASSLDAGCNMDHDSTESKASRSTALPNQVACADSAVKCENGEKYICAGSEWILSSNSGTCKPAGVLAYSTLSGAWSSITQDNASWANDYLPNRYVSQTSSQYKNAGTGLASVCSVLCNYVNSDMCNLPACASRTPGFAKLDEPHNRLALFRKVLESYSNNFNSVRIIPDTLVSRPGTSVLVPTVSYSLLDKYLAKGPVWVVFRTRLPDTLALVQDAYQTGIILEKNSSGQYVWANTLEAYKSYAYNQYYTLDIVAAHSLQK